ncbi:MAG: IS4 family transposase, partial [Terriglobia bacterium]
MNRGRSVFAQIMDYIPRYPFQVCVDRYHGNSYVKSFPCWDQFLCMAFAQLTYRESLRDIETCLRSMQTKLYHMGFRDPVARSTLADANENRDWRIYADFPQALIRSARALYLHDPFDVDLEQTAYALDSTTIDLCLTLFPWAQFRKHKAAVKLHTLLDLRGSIPTFIRVTSGKVHDVNILDDILPEPGSLYVMDRGYIDFARLLILARASAFYITRAKQNLQFHRRYSRPVDPSTGLRCDQTIYLTGVKTAKDYPDSLRRIHYFDPETERRLTFLTNNFSLPALNIAQLYKSRWRVELFFKWIKQHLRIKAFYGTSENAVKTQVWIAVSVYVLVAILKK